MNDRMDRESVRQAAKKIKLIALDLDGTSLDDAGRFSPRTRAAVQALADKGYLVVPATGRGYYGLTDGLLGVTGILYVISANGAVVTETATGRRLAEKLIPCEEAARLAAALFAPGNCVYLHRNDAYSTHIMACPSREEYQNIFWRPGWTPAQEILTRAPEEFIRADRKSVVKLGVWFTRPDGFDYYEALAARDHPQVRGFRVSDHSMEFSHREASKAAALRTLAGQLGLAPQQVCALGDNGNDVEMLRWAGLGVAMENAIDAAKAAADHIAGQNDAAGAAQFLEEFFLS